jgi:AraC-like DNA-binding protein
MGEPAFISKQVESGAYYFLDLDPSPRAPLTVVCGGREVCGAAYRIDRQKFPYHSIELVASGRGSVTLDGTRHRLQPGVLFRYGPGIAHEMAVEPGSRLLKYFVDFTGTACARLLADGPWSSLQPLQLAEPARAQAIYEELLRVGARQTPLAGRLCALLLQQLVLLAADEAVPAAGLDSAAWATYRRCREHMEAHYASVRSLGDLAAACGTSAAHVCRLFRRYGARSPYQALLRLKMARAASLLLDRALPVRQAGAEVGFEDPYHFSKAFKRVHGLSPQAFRAGGRPAGLPSEVEARPGAGYSREAAMAARSAASASALQYPQSSRTKTDV